MAAKSRITESLVIALAIASRVAAVLVLQSHLVPRSTYEHGEIAANLLAGRGFSMRFLGADGPTSQQAPVYPALVAVAYGCYGVGTPKALLPWSWARRSWAAARPGSVAAGTSDRARTPLAGVDRRPGRRTPPHLDLRCHPRAGRFTRSHTSGLDIGACLSSWGDAARRETQFIPAACSPS